MRTLRGISLHQHQRRSDGRGTTGCAGGTGEPAAPRAGLQLSGAAQQPRGQPERRREERGTARAAGLVGSEGATEPRAGRSPPASRRQRFRLKLASSGQSCCSTGCSTGCSIDGGGSSGAVRRDTASSGRRRDDAAGSAEGCWAGEAARASMERGAGLQGSDSGTGRCGLSCRAGEPSCQGSRQPSSSSSSQSSLSSTQRPRWSRRRGDPAREGAERVPGREPGRAPATPSTSCRPAAIH